EKVSTGHLITGLHQCCSHNMGDVSNPTLQELPGNSYTQVGRKAGENGSTCIDCSGSVRDGHSTGSGSAHHRREFPRGFVVVPVVPVATPRLLGVQAGLAWSDVD